MSLIGLFLDMTGASSGRIIEEVLKNESLPQEAKDALQGVADLERSRALAVLHLLSILSTLDTNLKLMRRQGVLSFSDMQPHLIQAAYQLPFDQANNHLFGEELAGVLALNDAYVSKRHTRQLHQTIMKQLSTKSTKPKQPQGQQHPKRHPKGRSNSQEDSFHIARPRSTAYPPKDDKSNSRKPDKGKNNSS